MAMPSVLADDTCAPLAAESKVLAEGVAACVAEISSDPWWPLWGRVTAVDRAALEDRTDSVRTDVSGDDKGAGGTAAPPRAACRLARPDRGRLVALRDNASDLRL